MTPGNSTTDGGSGTSGTVRDFDVGFAMMGVVVKKEVTWWRGRDTVDIIADLGSDEPRGGFT